MSGFRRLWLCALLALPAQAGQVTGLAVSAQTGEPLASVELNLSPVRTREEEQERRRRRGAFPQGSIARTALDGRFVFDSVEPGDYVVSASKAGYEGGGRKPLRVTLTEDAASASVRFELNRSPSVSGRVVDADGDPLPNARVELRGWAVADRRRMLRPIRGAEADDLGRFRIHSLSPGQYLLYLHPTKLTTAQGGVLHETLPVYYPQGSSAAEAAKLSLGWGQDLESVELVAAPAGDTLVSGAVLQSDGLVCQSCSVTIVDGAGLPVAATRLSDNGRFAIHGLAGGEYVFAARAPRGGGLGVETVYLAEDRPVELALRLVPAQPVSGTLVAVDSDSDEPVAFDRSGVTLIPAAGNVTGQRVGERAAANGTFSITTAPAGRYAVVASGLPSGGYMRRVSLGGRVLPGAELQITGDAPVSGLEIEIALDGGSLRGQAVAEDGESPAPPEGMVILTPLDDTAADQTQIVGYGSDGMFQLRGIAPGKYRIFATSRNAAWDWTDPALAADLNRRASRIEIDPEETLDVTAPFLAGPVR